MVRSFWLPWFLRWFFLALAGFLIILILACPFLDDGRETPNYGQSLLAAFASDRAVRRTAIASSLGLVVTALVFFRPQRVSAATSSEESDLTISENNDS
jgi:hypothetical protein